MTRETRSSAASPRVPRHEDVTAQTLGNTETRSEWREARVAGNPHALTEIAKRDQVTVREDFSTSFQAHPAMT
jgi:hypothetical protein